jgi:hypothetical protein
MDNDAWAVILRCVNIAMAWLIGVMLIAGFATNWE